MNFRQGFVLFCAFVLYLVMGSVVFRKFENNTLERTPMDEMMAINAFKIFLMDNESEGLSDIVADEWRQRVSSAYDTYIDNVYRNVTLRDWSFYDGFFFSLTVVTTIGYGNLAPTTPQGRCFCIFYALFGIPITGILLAAIGDFFSSKLLAAHERSRQRSRYPRLALTFNTINYLIPGLILFLFLPASVFVALEGWTFLEAFYYAVITLMTIGFGDYVAGTHADPYQWAYKVGLMCWIVFGLGYLSMILNFISKAMKSKHVKKIERTVTKNLKYTQLAFNKELAGFMRQMNDFYNNKVKMKKMVANAQARRQMPRTSSCPSMVSEHNRPQTMKRSASADSFAVTGGAELDVLNEYAEHAEGSANFIFELALAMAYGSESSPAASEQQDSSNQPDPIKCEPRPRSRSIAHIFSAGMAYLNPNPAFRKRNSMTPCNNHLENNISSAFQHLQIDARKKDNASLSKKMSSSSLFDNFAYRSFGRGGRTLDVRTPTTMSPMTTPNFRSPARRRSLIDQVPVVNVDKSFLHELSASRLQNDLLKTPPARCDFFIGSTDSRSLTTSLAIDQKAGAGDGEDLCSKSPNDRRRPSLGEIMDDLIEEESCSEVNSSDSLNSRSTASTTTSNNDRSPSKCDSANCYVSRETVVIDIDGVRSVGVLSPQEVQLNTCIDETASFTHL